MLWNSFILIFIAEMADKTQLMMISLAQRYKTSDVLIGMSLGVSIISAISIFIGNLIGDVIPLHLLKVMSGLLFLYFAFSTLIFKEQTNNKPKHYHRFIILSIALSFILAELGDKTQLSTIALASKQSDYLNVFIGSSCGLILANVLGVFFGKLIFSHIKDSTIQILSAYFFILFGSFPLFEVLPYSLPFIIIYSFAIITLAYLIHCAQIKKSTSD
ncbi:MAG: TMEM165/GDT1 family protein [Erysipelotrichaceae bacterium]